MSLFTLTHSPPSLYRETAVCMSLEVRGQRRISMISLATMWMETTWRSYLMAPRRTLAWVRCQTSPNQLIWKKKKKRWCWSFMKHHSGTLWLWHCDFSRKSNSGSACACPRVKWQRYRNSLDVSSQSNYFHSFLCWSNSFFGLILNEYQSET